MYCFFCLVQPNGVIANESMRRRTRAGLGARLRWTHDSEETLPPNTLKTFTCALQVVANKSDAAPDAGAGMGARLGLEHLEGRAKRVQPVCALTGDGVREGLQWLIEQARPRAMPKHDSAWRRGPFPPYVCRSRVSRDQGLSHMGWGLGSTWGAVQSNVQPVAGEGEQRCAVACRPGAPSPHACAGGIRASTMR